MFRVRSRRLSRSTGFWLVGAILVMMLCSSTVPSPMYVVYEQRWQMSSTLVTVVFAVYAFAVLAALLVAGSLSDDVGRRPVLLCSLALVMASMLIFALAQDVSWLLAARAVQGVGVGLATGAMSAALLDLAPERAPQRGTLVNGVGPTLGLALGSVLAGMLVEYAPAPTILSYVLLLAGFAATAVGVWRMPEPVSRRRGRVRIRIRRVSIPRRSRRAFFLLAPGLVAVWAVGGFFLALGPSLAVDVLHSTNHLVGGLTVGVLAGVAVAGQLLAGRMAPSRAALAGLLVLLCGLALLLFTLIVHSAPMFFAGTAVLGAGWGITFLGVLRSLVGLAEPAHRGELMSAVYVVSYLAMSAPVILAGWLTGVVGLRRSAEIFIAVVAALCVSALVALRPSQRPLGGSPRSRAVAS